MADTERLRIEYMPLSKLVRAPRNPKGHDLGAIDASLTRFGYVEPIGLNETTGRLVCGHGRVDTLQQQKAKGAQPPKRILVENGEWLVPVLRGASFADDMEAEGYLIASNRTMELGGWDDQGMLAQMLGDQAALDKLVGTGFDGDELDELLRKTTSHVGLTDPDDIPDRPDQPNTQPGDLHFLGKHRVLCGDSTNESDVRRLLDGHQANIVFTDPPYGVGYEGGTLIRQSLIGDTTTELYKPCCKMAFLFSVPDAPLYLWHAGVKGIAAAAAAAAIDAGWEIRCELIWNKNQAQYGALSAQYKQKHEPCYYCFKKGRTVNWVGPTNETTVWDINRSPVNDLHPTQKPVALAQRALANHDAKICLDLFLGSGSTVIACEQMNRRCFGIEIDPAYCDIIVKRWEDFTGQQATRERA